MRRVSVEGTWVRTIGNEDSSDDRQHAKAPGCIHHRPNRRGSCRRRTRLAGGAARRPVTDGYWEVVSECDPFAFKAPFDESMGGQHFNKPVVAMASPPSGQGSWEVASDDALFSSACRSLVGRAGCLCTNRSSGNEWLSP